MAAVTSLGIHTPVALPYLIEEGLIPETAKPSDYQWDTYVYSDANGDIEEEVFATEDSVVWSQGTFIKAVYRFQVEGEEVCQALLTNFPAKDIHQGYTGEGHNVLNGVDKVERHRSQDPSLGSGQQYFTRALVVVLKSKAHVYFLRGLHHVIDLPFKVDRAFAAPRGLIIQRAVSRQSSRPSTPSIPPAPQNSFFSSQGRSFASHLQSPTLKKTFNSAQHVSSGVVDERSMLDSLYDELTASTQRHDEEEQALLYSLTNPLADLSVLSCAVQLPQPRLLHRRETANILDFETLDPAEEIVYVSSSDELANVARGRHGPLLLVITSNMILHTITVWHGWYVGEKSLRSLLKRRADHKDMNARRRSSFPNASAATGTTTPAVRHREGVRESFAAVGSTREHATASRKPTQEEEENAFASQMDPDYLPSVPDQGREARRISSMIARGEADPRASQASTGASFGGHIGHRNPSFGRATDRRSVGRRRKSRGSTPGSTFSRSLGPEDSTMLDDDYDKSTMENSDDLLKHIRATYETAAVDGVFGSSTDLFKHELIVEKIHSVELDGRYVGPSQLTGPQFKAVTLCNAIGESNTAYNIGIWIRDRQQAGKDLYYIEIEIQQKPLWPEDVISPVVALPRFVHERRIPASGDLVNLKDAAISAVLLDKNGIVFNVRHLPSCKIPDAAPYRVFDAHSVRLQSGFVDSETGKNREFSSPSISSKLLLDLPGSAGSFDEIWHDGTHHRRRLKFVPSSAMVAKVIEVCESVLPSKQACMVRSIWCSRYAVLVSENKGLSTHDIEFVALAATILSFCTHLLHDKALASLKVTNLAANKSQSSAYTALVHPIRALRHQEADDKTWSWIEDMTEVRSGTAQLSSTASTTTQRRQFLLKAFALAAELVPSIQIFEVHDPFELRDSCVRSLLLGLHVFREDQKLNILNHVSEPLAAIIAQMGSLLSLPAWSYRPGMYYNLEGASEDRWNFVKTIFRNRPQANFMAEPMGVHCWWERALITRSREAYPSLETAAASQEDPVTSESAGLCARSACLSKLLQATSALTAGPEEIAEAMISCKIDLKVLETLPQAFAAPLQEAIAFCERAPPTTWPEQLLDLVGRHDLNLGKRDSKLTSRALLPLARPVAHEAQLICHTVESLTHATKSKEANRHAVSQLIFSEDRRLVEAVNLMHYNTVQVAECPKQADWSDAQHLEHQRRVTLWVMARMVALPPGDGMIHYDSQTPLLTERFLLPGFNANCVMYPMGQTVTADRSSLTEERVNWAYFHAGVSAGLRISRNMQGLDTSWIVFNKPNELTNRHAGLLLALGLGGHLRSLAKWLSFKYLTPKHTMTSVGLLLGLSASYMGTMDNLVTRMLSVHITRLLPPGAAELNVSATTQTAGLMGIGLLYYNTQHRRMSEIMISEVEHMEIEDPDNEPDLLRDESYRLAAGFALGFINLGKGNHMRGLHGMHLPERLLNVAVGPRWPMDRVHVFDKATAGAVIALALVYMKTEDCSIARKLDIPDTEAQYDQVRPDMLMLRTMAKHIIMWESIRVPETTDGEDRPTWVAANLPVCYRSKLRDMATSSRGALNSADVPFFNVCTGLAWALSLKYAGTSNVVARDEVLTVLEHFHAYKDKGDAYYYDGKLARAALRRCIDVLALAAAIIMAGTGDLQTFRHLRRLHGRVDAETPYGSHMAAHLAIGMLFLAGGTYTFSTSKLAVASLICATYPLFPTDVHDNRVHLQAFRHFWVFAAEARCIVVADIDSQRPISMPIEVILKDGSARSMTAPCLLPELDTIATIRTSDLSYWQVTLDFSSSPDHLNAFRTDQRILVRRCPVGESHSTAFSATLAALNDSQSKLRAMQAWDWIFSLPGLKDVDRASAELILPSDLNSSVHSNDQSTVVDDRLVLQQSVSSVNAEALRNLRGVFAWAEKAKEDGDGTLRWLGYEVLQELKLRIDERSRAAAVEE